MTQIIYKNIYIWKAKLKYKNKKILIYYLVIQILKNNEMLKAITI